MANIKEPVANVGDSIARPHSPTGNDDLNRISGFQVAASYNWLEKKNPTIMVPGVPPIWSPPPTTPVLKPDSGPRYVDQNTDRNPASPLDSLVLAVQTYQPDFNFAAIDVISDRRPLRKLYGFVAGEPESFEFGVDIVGNTAIFVRIENQTREELPSTTFHGFRQAFEEQYTKPSASAKGSTSHHRIVQYSFGGLSLLVRSAVDAYLEELVEGADSSVVAHSRDPLDYVNSEQNLSLGGRVATPSETGNEVDGRVTVVQGGQKVPHAAVLELTTRSAFARRPFVIEQKMADLWISQTPTFIEAYHRGVGYKAYNQHRSQQGRFEDIRVKSISDLLTKWETTNAKVLGKLATVLKQVVLGVKKARSPCIVRYKGQGACLGLSTIEALPSLSEDMKSLFQLKKPSLKKPEMTALKAGDTFPEDVKFSWVPYTEEKDSITSCGVPQTYDASKEFAGKKVVLFAVPGAFTPGCSVRHLPGYIEHLDEIKGKGVDVVIVIAMNDAWVMSAWGKANGIKHDKILFMCDTSIAFSESIGWTRGADRTGRYAMVIDHGKIIYAENEPAGDVTVSGAEAVLTKL